VLGGWRAGDTISIERDIFPALIEAGEHLHGFLADPYWIDLGTPEKYLQAHFDIFEGKVDGLAYPAPWIAPEAGVDLRAHLGRWVAVGAGASIGPEVRIDDSVLHEGVRVEAGAVITGSVLARDVTVGEGAIVGSCVVGERGSVPAGARVTDARIDAGAEAVAP
jgi:mannose-1-phosphate guanylyltransferase